MLGARLLVADPDLGAGIPAEEYATAARLVVAPAERVPPGPWRPHGDVGSRGVFALLVAEGVMVRERRLNGHGCAHLFGPGDVMWLRRGADGLLPGDVIWSAMQPSTVVALGTHFRRATRRWPSLAENLAARALVQADRLAEHAAILQLARVDLRLLAVLWHLAERFGRVTPHGVVVPLELTHAQLGRLAGAQRSTVSLAVARLDDEGLVRRSESGWVLVPESRRSLERAPERAALPPG